MPRLSTGFTIVGAYAIKVRRALFAQLSDRVRQDRQWSRSIAYASAQLNRVLFELFVTRLRLDKGDVVRARIEFDLDEEKKNISWKWDTLTVDVYRRERPEVVEPALKEVVGMASQLAALVRYEVKPIGSTVDGDVVYSVMLEGREVGVIIVTSLGNSVLIKGGGVVEPSYAVVKRTRVRLGGLSPEEAIADSLPEVLQQEQDRERVVKIIEELRSRAARDVVKA